MNITEAVAALAKIDPAFALQVGELRDAGQLPPGRTGFAIERLQTLSLIAEKAEADPVDQTYLRQCAALEAFALLELGERLDNPDVMSALAEWGTLLSFAPFSSEQERGERLEGFLAQVPIYIAEAATTLGEPDPFLLELALDVAATMPAFFETLAPGSKEAMHATQAVNVFARELRSRPVRQRRRLYDRDTLAKLLQLRALPYDLQEIEELGHQRIGHLTEKRAVLAKDLTGYRDPKNALRAIAADTVGDLRALRDLTREAFDFCGDNDLVPMPRGDEELRIVASARDGVLTAKPLWPLHRSVLFVAALPSHASARLSAVRDGSPGHHLRSVVAAQQGSLWRNAPWTTQARIGGETTDGWAHYCEAFMAGRTFIVERDERLLVANEALMHAHAVLLDIELATGTVSFEKAAQRLVDAVAMPAAAAMQRVRRWASRPGSALSPTVGKHMIRDLRTAAQRHWQRGFSLRRFHALVMTHGSAPLTLASERLATDPA